MATNKNRSITDIDSNHINSDFT